MLIDISEVSYFVAAAAYLFLTGLIFATRDRPVFAKALLSAAALSTVWALIASFSDEGLVAQSNFMVVTAEVGRLLAWIVFLSLLVGLVPGRQAPIRPSTLAVVVSVLCVFALYFAAVPSFGDVAFDFEQRATVISTSLLTLNVVALLLLENLYRNSSEDVRWAVKYLCFGLGLIFAYDFFYFADVVLFREFNATLHEARGFVNAIAVPVVTVAVSRAQSWNIAIHVSRRVVFHTAALISCGIYLLIMSAAGYYVREWGGNWGSVLEITFLAGALLLLFIVFSSNSARTHARLFIARNFFSAQYDYRVEWLNFIEALSDETSDRSLHDRIQLAFAQVMDSTGAAFWLRQDEEGAFVPIANWNFGEALPREPASSALIAKLTETGDIATVADLANFDEAARTTPLARAFAEHGRAWILVPLLHRDDIEAIVALGTPRAKREIGWADRELLLSLGRLAASYLSEDASTRALAEARRWEELNRRFAFVAHDIKNVVNQLSLLVRNAEAHGDNPEFQKDMLVTIGSSVDRMKHLLHQLKDKSTESVKPAADRHIKLQPFLAKVARNWQGQYPSLAVAFHDVDATVEGDEQRLASALDHLVQNALDATNGSGRITLRSEADRSHVNVTVEDDGPGMDPEFVRQHLFRPLDSTKHDGFGMGVYQVRQYVQEMGGELVVDTAPGHGTRMKIRLPLAEPLVGASPTLEGVA